MPFNLIERLSLKFQKNKTNRDQSNKNTNPGSIEETHESVDSTLNNNSHINLEEEASSSHTPYNLRDRASLSRPKYYQSSH